MKQKKVSKQKKIFKISKNNKTNNCFNLYLHSKVNFNSTESQKNKSENVLPDSDKTNIYTYLKILCQLLGFLLAVVATFFFMFSALTYLTDAFHLTFKSDIINLFLDLGYSSLFTFAFFALVLEFLLLIPFKHYSFKESKVKKGML